MARFTSKGQIMTSKPAALAHPVPTVKMLLDGKFIESRAGEWHDVINPATQEVLAQVPFATDEELNAAVASAKKAFKTWKNTPLAARARIMLKLQALVREHMGRIAQTLSAEQGKTLADAEGRSVPRSRGGRARLLDRQSAVGGICRECRRRRGHLYVAAADWRLRGHHARSIFPP